MLDRRDVLVLAACSLAVVALPTRGVVAQSNEMKSLS
jgi:hypothetical protein